MPTGDADARQALLDRLNQSREEIREVLDPPRDDQGSGRAAGSGGRFPRSRTMRALLSIRGIGAAGALVGGLLIARPAIAMRLLRIVPVSMLGKMLLARTFAHLRSRKRET